MGIGILTLGEAHEVRIACGRGNQHSCGRFGAGPRCPPEKWANFAPTRNNSSTSKQLVETDTSVTSNPNPDNGGLHPGRRPDRCTASRRRLHRRPDHPCSRPRTPQGKAASSPPIPAPPPHLTTSCCSLSTTSSPPNAPTGARPVQPVEENGYYARHRRRQIHGRDRADTLIRFQQSGYKPAHREDGADLRRGNRYRVQRRAIISPTTSATWSMPRSRSTKAAATPTARGHIIDQSIQVGEKIYQGPGRDQPGGCRSRCATTRSTR